MDEYQLGIVPSIVTITESLTLSYDADITRTCIEALFIYGKAESALYYIVVFVRPTRPGPLEAFALCPFGLTGAPRPDPWQAGDRWASSLEAADGVRNAVGAGPEPPFPLPRELSTDLRTDCPIPPAAGHPRAGGLQAAFSRLRIASAWLALIRPIAIASITARARVQRVLIFFSPRIVCFSKPKLTSRRLLTRSTAVRRS